jgi:hypothetical protein
MPGFDCLLGDWPRLASQTTIELLIYPRKRRLKVTRIAFKVTKEYGDRTVTTQAMVLASAKSAAPAVD